MGADAIAAIPTKAVGLFGSSFTWPAALMALLNLLVGGALVALIKNWPALKKIAVERANVLDEERSGDMDKMRADIAEARGEAKAANKRSQKLENTLACVMPAVTILMAEVRRLDPNSESNASLKQAQQLISMAAAGDFGLSRAFADLAATPPHKD